MGFADYADATSLPLGLSPFCRNMDFPLGNPCTRDGLVTTMQGANAASVTGLISASYDAEDASESSYRLHGTYDQTGALQIEQPDGTGNTVTIATWASAVLINPPDQSHMFSAPAYNRSYHSFAQLAQVSPGRFSMVPSGPALVIDLGTKRVDPYGLRPYGEAWQPLTPYRLNEVVTPSIVGGNGHTYQCTQPGVSSAAEPSWPTLDSAGVVDGSAVWQEHTAVLANRIPQPAAPVLTIAGGGSFASGRDVYAILTAVNGQGETIASPASFVTTTAANQSVSVETPATVVAWLNELPNMYQIIAYRVYEADVATGQPAPAQSTYALAGQVAPGASLAVGSTASGVTPPQRNSARITPGMLPVPTDAPPVDRSVGTGTFQAGRDVYVRKTLLNLAGETPLSPSNSLINTQLNDAVQVSVETEKGYQVTSIGIYEADVANGADEPDKSAYALVGYYSPGATASVQGTATGSPAPIVNGTGAAGNITKDDPAGGLNASQGMRRAAIAFEDFQKTVSGIREAAVASTVVDEDGWELGIYHVPSGPANVGRRLILPTAANGTTAGPFFKIEPSAVSDGVLQTTTVIPDNTTPFTVMNFTDSYLNKQTDFSYRLQTIQPKQCVDLYYAPSVDRFFQSGVLGFTGHWVSRAADAGTYQGDVGYISVGSDGEKAYCVREFREVVYSLRERSGFTLTPNTADPSGWIASRKWKKVGPCGPRAVDVGREVMCFVHRSGVYAFDGGGDPQNVSAELPDEFGKFWRTINWQYAETIWMALDEERKVVRIGVPTGVSTAPDTEVALWFSRGWSRPVSQDQEDARCISINPIAANLAMRWERNLQSSDGDASFRTSQFVYASAGGAVKAIQPGRRDDDGQGIDCQYALAGSGEMLEQSRYEGFIANMIGEGQTNVALLSGQNGLRTQLRPISLDLQMNGMVARNTPAKLNERWRLIFDNGAKAGSWFELRQITQYLLTGYKARTQGSSR